MAKGVVAIFKSVEIEHEKAEGIAMPFGSCHFILQPFVQITPVQEAGKGIGYGQFFELFSFIIKYVPLHDDSGMGRKGLDEIQILFIEDFPGSLVRKVEHADDAVFDLDWHTDK